MKKFVIAVAAVVLAAFAAPAFAAMNPFMDVPASHWAYDAVAQLAARGVISGYPDGTYKGAKPTTRYEMASALARALATVDMEKASKQDVEMLKRLVVEFKDELDALGVKVDSIDKRVAVLEKDLGGWSLSGQFRFDAKFSGEQAGDLYGMNGKNDFDLNRYRIFLKKRINETTSFTARLGATNKQGNGRADVRFEQYYIDTLLGYDIKLRAGVYSQDWESDLGLYHSLADSGFAYTQHLAAFRLEKEWGKANLQLVIGRENDRVGLGKDITAMANAFDFERFLIAAKVDYEFTEKFSAGVMAYYNFGNGDEKPFAMNGTAKEEIDNDLLTIGVHAKFAFTPSVALKGVYYYQKQSDYFKGLTNLEYAALTLPNEDKANMWKLILDVKQEALNFTDLWFEYGQYDNNFFHYAKHEGNGGFGIINTSLINKTPLNTNKTKYFSIVAQQKWNEKWRTFLYYMQADYDTDGYDTGKNYALGVAYRLNPAVEFELAWDKVDLGTRAGVRDNDENLIRFRTFVTF